MDYRASARLGKRDAPPYDGSNPNPGAQRQAPADGRQAVAHVDQAASLRRRAERKADTGVAGLEAERRGVFPQTHGRLRVSTGVLCDVLQRLQAAEVDRRLGLGRI